MSMLKRWLKKHQEEGRGFVRVGTEEGHIVLAIHFSDKTAAESVLTPEMAKTVATELGKAADKVLLGKRLANG